MDRPRSDLEEPFQSRLWSHFLGRHIRSDPELHAAQCNGPVRRADSFHGAY